MFLADLCLVPGGKARVKDLRGRSIWKELESLTEVGEVGGAGGASELSIIRPAVLWVTGTYSRGDVLGKTVKHTSRVVPPRGAT